MVSTPEDKERRRKRMKRDHIARDLRFKRQVIPDRKRKYIDNEDEVYYDYDSDSNP